MTHRSLWRIPASRRRGLLAFVPALLLALSGCVTMYQPLASLQRPVVVDPQVANFQGLRMAVRCVPGEHFSASNADYLCRRLQNLFTNQGAQVELEVLEPGSSLGGVQAGPPSPPPDLVVEARSRQVHYDNSKLLWAVSICTGTLVPAVTETTVALDLAVRGHDGALLAADTLQARFVRYMGVSVWTVNSLLNWLVRSDEEDLGDKTTRRDFSRDLYGQVSQLAFHAHMRSVVLRGFEPAAAPAVPSPAAFAPRPVPAPPPVPAPAPR